MDLCRGSDKIPVYAVNKSGETICPVCKFTTPVQAESGRIRKHSKPTYAIDFKTGNRRTKITIY